jgi:uncharacterized protein (UPF0276 family)
VTGGDVHALAVGIGLKAQHVADVLARRDLDFVEVHAENYMVAGGPLPARLARVRAHCELSVHGVGLSIGSAGPLDAAHLERLAALVERCEPRWVSEHLAWSSHGGVWCSDLLPLPYDAPTLARVCEHVDQVQQRLRRRILLENPSTYVEFDASTMNEGEFLAAVVARTGCGLLLDVNNAYVSAVNHGRDARALIDALPADAVGEIHLAGHAEDRDGAGDRLLIDAHGSPVADAVWALYRHAVARCGPRPTLIERDHDVPSYEVLAAEARRAARAMREVVAGATDVDAETRIAA